MQAPIANEVLETVQNELADRFELQVLVRHERGSTLYLARDLEDDRLVSLRLIPRQGPVEGPLIHRFAQAATLAAQLRHPHLIPLRKHGVTTSLLWYSTDVVKSRTLGMTLEGADPMPLARTLELLEQAASGLEYLHRNAVVHGGLGCETILVDGEGWVRVSDPGTAAAIYRAAGPGVGWEALLDLPCAAPELLDRRLMGPAADQYSLAAVAYRCLAGQPPFTGDSVESIRRDRTGVIPALRDLRSDLPPHVETAILRALRDEPAERFGSALDFVAVLSGAAVRQSSAMLVPSVRPSGAPMMVGQPGQRSRGRWRLAIAAITVGVLATAGGWAYSRMQRAGDAGWAEGPTPAPVMAPPTAAPTAGTTPSPSGADAARDPGADVGPVAPAVVAPAPAQPVAPPATLFVNATPWGSLYVDDRLIGNTPQVNLRVAAGTHRLRIVRDGFAPWVREVDLGEGDVLRLTDIVLDPIRQ
ncbi:MAG: protein kinase [Gemmatimonadota bacterium]|nr:protein kinase [Gemmatimonadota bacterium]